MKNRTIFLFTMVAAYAHFLGAQLGQCGLYK